MWLLSFFLLFLYELGFESVFSFISLYEINLKMLISAQNLFYPYQTCPSSIFIFFPRNPKSCMKRNGWLENEGVAATIVQLKPVFHEDEEGLEWPRFCHDGVPLLQGKLHTHSVGEWLLCFWDKTVHQLLIMIKSFLPFFCGLIAS